ncbi:MAG: hypothetical protein AAF438_07865 [Pseudomonadota bacterium]
MLRHVTGVFLLLTIPALASANVKVQVAQAEDVVPPKTDDIEISEGGSKSESLRAAEALREAVKTNEKAAHTVELICRTERRLGSRIKKNRCLTLAQWAHEAEKRVLQAASVPTNTAPKAWNTTP